MERYRPMSNIIFGDVNLRDYNAFSFGCHNLFERAQRDVDIISVPGRQGDLVLDNGRYKNLKREYQIQCTGVKNIEALMKKLSGMYGYYRLEDEYDEDVFYEARLANKPDITRFVGDAASIKLSFDRKPQRWLKSGENIAIEGTYIGKQGGDGSGHGFSYPTVGVVKIVINNPYNEIMYPKIIVPGKQPQFAWGFWARQLNEDVSVPNGDKLNYVIPHEGDDSGRRYTDDEAVGNYLLFHVQKNTQLNDPHSKTEFDSESRTVIHGTSYNPNDTYNSQWSEIDRFPVLNPGKNYIYFMFRNYSIAASGADIAWENLHSPTVYPRWWEI